MDNIALVFTGQGAQYSGMGKSFYDNFPRVKEIFDSSEKYRPGTLDTCFYGDDDILKDTENTQPCLYLANVGAAIALQESGISPKCLAGFSLGEISALAISRAVSYELGFEIASNRGKIMKKAAKLTNSSMMAIVGLSPKIIEEMCEKIGKVYPVNYNSPKQTVVAGDKDALVILKSEIINAGGRAIVIAVSSGFHSPYMDTAALEFKSYLSTIDIGVPQTTLYSNVTAKPYEKDAKELLCKQINNPVHWATIVGKMIDSGIDTFIEVGAGSVLSKLILQNNQNVRVFTVEKTEDIASLIENLKCSKGAVYA